MYNLEGSKSKIKKSSKTDIAIIHGRDDGPLDQVYGKEWGESPQN